jgi:hypothetical protein
LDESFSPLPSDCGPDQILLQIYTAEGTKAKGALPSSVMLALVLMPVKGMIYRRVGVAEISIIDNSEEWDIGDVTVI